MGHMFLILTDVHSNWIEASIVTSTVSETTIRKLEEIFSIHGYPEQLVSNNGSGFTSSEFQQYTHQRGILHTRTAPYHPQSNGLAEHSVQTVKQGLKKLTGPIQNRLSNLLFQYRITPHSSTGLSPAEVLMGRRLRCNLTLLHPDTGNRPKRQQQKLLQDQQKQSHSFAVGEELYAKSYQKHTNHKWISVKVKNKTGPVSYQVITNDGQTLRRHVDQLKKRYEDGYVDVTEGDDDDWFRCGLRHQPMTTGVPERAITTFNT